MVALSAYPALVLNADYQPLSYYPLSLWGWQDTVKAIFLDRVAVVSHYDHVIRSPGLELRLPVLFDAMVSRGRMDVNAFVRLTSTEPARIYGLQPQKGSIAIGADADLCLWDPDREVEIGQGPRHDNAGYTPYAGKKLRGWPVTVLRRGEVIADRGQLLARPGSGIFLPRSGGPAATPAGRPSFEFDPVTSFGAKLA